MLRTNMRYMRIILFITISIIFPMQVQESVGQSEWDDVVDVARDSSLTLLTDLDSYAVLEALESYITDLMLSEYGITLDIVIVQSSDIATEVDASSEVDLIWSHHANLVMLSEQELLLTDWATKLPNFEIIDPQSFEQDLPTFDARTSLVPWGQYVWQWAHIIDGEFPQNTPELTRWIENNPGRFTYISPNNIYGNLFLQMLLIDLSGDADIWRDDFDEMLYEEWSTRLWEILNQWDPNLWENGRIYARNINELNALVANGETDMSFTLALSGASISITNGDLPASIRGALWDGVTIRGSFYLGIPSTSDNSEGAQAAVNLFLSPEVQATMLLPSSNFGLGSTIDINAVSAADLRPFSQAFTALTDIGVDVIQIEADSVGQIALPYQEALRRDWQEFFGREEALQ